MKDKTEILLGRLREIGEEVRKKEGGLALLALGSAGMDTDRLDCYSDLDFFVLTEKQNKNDFLLNLDWLSTRSPLLYEFRNSDDGYKILYEDGVFCEFAVFDIDELQNVDFSEGRIIWKSNSIDDALLKPSAKKKHAIQTPSTVHLINEALTNVYVGLGRYYRGEIQSAFEFIQHFAWARVIELIEFHLDANRPDGDSFNHARRFEKRHPAYQSSIVKIAVGATNALESAQAVLDFIEPYASTQEKKLITHIREVFFPDEKKP